jgi:(S)-2-hydroxyglutarate dehydrogenase
MQADLIVIGAGIVGLATAYKYQQMRPKARVLVIEKEPKIARHQTGHNSGVIHSGIYYAPGSLKAELCRHGASLMVSFCQQFAIPHAITGKLIAATSEHEIPGLLRLAERAKQNGVPTRMLTPAEARTYEPHLTCLQALQVESTGITDYTRVAQTLANLVKEAGGEILLQTTARFMSEDERSVTVSTDRGDYTARHLISCAGLWSDRIADQHDRSNARIIPFRGEYYELRPEAHPLVRGLIYPVPDPNFPFLGVHLTRGIDGSVHAGPNAVLALARAGYTWGQVNFRDLIDSLSYPGFQHLVRKHWRAGTQEVLRSFSKRLFTASLQRFIPELTAEDLLPAPAGVRAQAVLPDGTLADDFLLVRGESSVHVVNAPSPAATASLAIGQRIAAMIATGSPLHSSVGNM